MTGQTKMREMRNLEIICKSCKKILGFLKTKYYINNTEFVCINCYFNSLPNEARTK